MRVESNDAPVQTCNMNICLVQAGCVIGEECLTPESKYLYTVVVRSAKVVCFIMKKSTNIPEFYTHDIYDYLLKKFNLKQYFSFLSSELRSKIIEGMIKKSSNPAVTNALFSNKDQNKISRKTMLQEITKGIKKQSQVDEGLSGQFDYSKSYKEWRPEEIHLLRTVLKYIFSHKRISTLKNIKLKM